MRNQPVPRYSVLFALFFLIFIPALATGQTAPSIITLYDQTIKEGFPLEFIVSASGSSLVYSASGLPQGAVFKAAPSIELYEPYLTGYKFSWTPAVGQTGTFSITFTVASGSVKSSKTVKLTVESNCLLNGPRAGFACRGDGSYVENVKREYGADANTTGEPIGGGVGYSKIIDPAAAKVVVSTKDQLLSALNSATSGAIIYVADNASIDLSGSQNITIPAGVTLASGRGRNNSMGALIYSNTLPTSPLFKTGGTNVRVTGLRLKGPDQNLRTEQMLWLGDRDRYYDVPVARGIYTGYSNLTVDNCEMFGWSQAAVVVYLKCYNINVHHNFIHRNQRQGLGYGVSMYNDASVLVEGNVFGWNRHSVTGVGGTPGTNYEARYNVVLGSYSGHYFDMHGGDDSGNASLPAGNNIIIHHNTFIANDYYSAVLMRGVPATTCSVYKNWATFDTVKFATTYIYRQAVSNLGLKPYVNMSVTDNYYGPTPPPAVSTGNRFPVITVPAAKTVNEDSLLNFTVTATDADGDAITFNASGLPAGASFNSASRAFSWTPGYSQAGSYTVTFTASDGKGGSASAVTKITVANVNQQPVISLPLVSTVTENTALNFAVSATDPDGDTITFSASGLPAGAAFNGSTGAFSWIPGTTQGGSYTVTFTASDGKGGSAFADASIKVLEANRAPVLAAIGAKTVTQGATLSFTVSAADPDGNMLTYSAENLPSGAVFTASTRTFSWTPTAAGTFTARFKVSDGSLTDSEDITITVTAGNKAPVLASIGAKTVTQGAILSFTVSAADPDGNMLTYSAENLPSGAVFTASTRTFSWTPTAAGTFTARFKVSDGSLTDSEDIVITVIAAAVGKPSAPTNLSATNSTSTCTLSWRDNAVNETGFYIEVGSISGKTFTHRTYVGANATSFSFPLQNKQLIARVQAYNKAGVSAYSNTVVINQKPRRGY